MTAFAPPFSNSSERPHRHRFTRGEYYQMAAAGMFQNQRVELLDGEIIDIAPQKSAHFCAVEAVVDALKKVFGEHFWVRAQGPLHLAADSAPEPDVAVVNGNRKMHHDHPTTAVLVVEVSDSTLRFDRHEKASFYAKAGVADYWIVNIPDRCVEVMRTPVADAREPHGASYSNVASFGLGETVSPLANPGASILVQDLFA